MVDPTCSATWPTRLRPRAVQGFAFGMGIERIAMLKHGVPTCGCSTTTTSASWSSSDEAAARLAARLLRPGSDRRRWPSAWT
jgi:hypothetical protein